MEKSIVTVCYSGIVFVACCHPYVWRLIRL